MHRFDTEKSEIAEGLIWASMLVVVLKRGITHAAQLATGAELSTQGAASCAKHVLDDILRCLLRNVPDLRTPLIHPALEALGVQAAKELDVTKRVAILKQIQDTLVNEGPYVVWGQPTRYYGSTPKVDNVKTDPVFMIDLNALTKSS